MKKYLALKVFYTMLWKHRISLAFAIRGNQFCLLPCIRWKYNLIDTGYLGWELKDGQSIHIMFLVFVIGFKWKQIFK